MTEITIYAARMAIVCAFATGLSACTTPDYQVPDNAINSPGPRQVETLGETIAREQQGEDGCLVASNIHKGRECAKLRETISPPSPPSEPKS